MTKWFVFLGDQLISMHETHKHAENYKDHCEHLRVIFDIKEGYTVKEGEIIIPSINDNTKQLPELLG